MILYNLFISGAEIAFTFFIALLVFGAGSLPEMARGMAKTIRIIRDASSGIKEEITRTAKKNGLDANLSGKIQDEMKKIKNEFGGIAGNFKHKI